MGDQDGEARDLASMGHSLIQKFEMERAVSYLARAMKGFLRLEIADGPRQLLPGLRMCLTTMGVKDFSAACERAKLEPRTVTELIKVLELRLPTPTAR
jgi:hypothetical protein